jgi:TPR repeat protein
MAGFYMEGIGVEKNPGVAMELLIKDREIRSKTGAQRNHATNNILLLYNSGDLSTTQMTRLLSWMEETARKTDDDEMMAVIANIYLTKENASTADYRIAMDYAMKSANKGNPGGCFWVGYMYSKGYGDIKRNEVNAFTWMLKAAEKGDHDAMRMVSNYYENGTGIEANPALAEEWKKRAGPEEQ